MLEWYNLVRTGLTLSTEYVIGGGIVQDIESLFLTPQEQRRPRQLDRSDEVTQQLPVDAISNGRPPEDILVSYTIHMSRVKDTCIGVHKVVGEQKVVPHVNPIRGRVIASLKVSIHAEKPRQCTVYRIVESSSVKGTMLRSSEKILLC